MRTPLALDGAIVFNSDSVWLYMCLCLHQWADSANAGLGNGVVAVAQARTNHVA